jgi:predicted HAD superfamily Cof-like phosphohydrolase
MGQPVLDVPCVPSEARVRLRLRLIAEEFAELLEASVVLLESERNDLRWHLRRIVDECPVLPVLPDVVDALADLDYVIEGTRLEFGVDGEPVAKLVHEANMAKVGGAVRVDGKIQKPAGWAPPDVVGALRAQGWIDGSSSR